ncbi:MAG TPA: putative Ig domain-containing protein, partial [Blastocatellia bacterium]|nr:putative Ig domain-containing protein [Blastocatellia bacterium]
MSRFLTARRLVPAILFALLLLSASSFASTLIVPSDDEMIVRARAIVRGKVVGVYSQFDDTRHVVFTYVTLRVKEVLKGEIRSREVVIKMPGGEDRGLATVVHGTPAFSPGENALVYLASWPDGSLAVDNLFLGKFSLVEESASGQTFVVREAPGSHVDVLPGSGPCAATDRMELGAYRRMVKDRLRVNQDRVRAFEEAHYRGTPIRLAPPEYDPSRTAGIQPQFHLLFNTRWFEPDSDQTVKVAVVADNLPTPTMMDEVAAACAAWSTVPGCALRLESGSTTTECLTSGLITISTNIACSWLPPSSGFIGFSGLNPTPSERKIVNGVSFARAGSGFVTLNPNGGVSESCQLREVLTHEIGHALGLHHSWDSSFEGSPSASDIEATMFWVAHFDGRCASLRTDDENGIRFIYPGIGGGPTDPTITSSALPVAIVGAPYSQVLTAIGGRPPYTWGLGSSSNPLPAGFSLSPSGVLSGTPGAVGTTIVRIKVADSASRSTERDFSITVASSGSPLNAALVSQSVPSSIGSSQSFNVSFTWRNSGVDTWSAAIG